MKKLTMLVTMLVAINMSMAQTIRVEGDQNLNMDISNIKTFAWSTQVDNKLDPGLFFFNDLILKADVREAIESELMGLGYKKDAADPDMLVNFRLFEKPVTIKGFEDFGTDYWTGIQVRDPDSRTEYEVGAGTLMIHLIDAKSGQVVWQGFASGLIDGNTFIKDEGKIREAVNLIFEEFGRRANEYTRK